MIGANIRDLIPKKRIRIIEKKSMIFDVRMNKKKPAFYTDTVGQPN